VGTFKPDPKNVLQRHKGMAGEQRTGSIGQDRMTGLGTQNNEYQRGETDDAGGGSREAEQLSGSRWKPQ
jgi:hypothetical protein